MNLTELKENVFKASKTVTYKNFDLFGSFQLSSSSGSKNGEPSEINHNSKMGLTLRVWNKDNKSGVVSTSNLTLDGLKQAFEIALQTSVYNEQNYDFINFGSENLLYKTDNIEKNLVPISTLSKHSVACENFLLKSHPSIKSVPYNKIKQTYTSRFYLNSSDLFLNESKNSFICYFYPLATETNRTSRQSGALFFADSFDKLNPMGCAQESLEKLVAHLDYHQIPGGTYDVVFGPEAFLDLVESFGNFFNAQNIIDNKSIIKLDSVGKEIAFTGLSIVDDVFAPQNVFPVSFDEEGNQTKRLNIVDNGTLVGLIHSSYTAKKLKTVPTGHTVLGSKLGCSPHYLKIFSNDDKKDLKIQGPHIYIESIKALHAGINRLQGSFSLPFDGFLFSDGQRKSIESATVAGDFLTLLKNIFYIGQKSKPLLSGLCPEIGVRGLSVTSSGKG